MKTRNDTVIEEIRESRRRISEQVGHNPVKFIKFDSFVRTPIRTHPTTTSLIMQ